MKIGVTSQNFRTITGHAGKSRRFLVFRQNEQGHWLETNRLDLPREYSMHEFTGSEHPIDEIDVLITASCGAGFLRKMAERGVNVITTSATDPLQAVKTLASGNKLPPADPHYHS